MSNSILSRIEEDINQLSVQDQILLMEHLAHRIRENTTQDVSTLHSQLELMANDPDIQRELKQIECEFAGTEMDGLGNE
jgi:hypothetical protein